MVSSQRQFSPTNPPLNRNGYGKHDRTYSASCILLVQNNTQILFAFLLDTRTMAAVHMHRLSIRATRPNNTDTSNGSRFVRTPALTMVAHPAEGFLFRFMLTTGIQNINICIFVLYSFRENANAGWNHTCTTLYMHLAYCFFFLMLKIPLLLRSASRSLGKFFHYAWKMLVLLLA